jgi:histone H3/H4
MGEVRRKVADYEEMVRRNNEEAELDRRRPGSSGRSNRRVKAEPIESEPSELEDHPDEMPGPSGYENSDNSSASIGNEVKRERKSRSPKPSGSKSKSRQTARKRSPSGARSRSKSTGKAKRSTRSRSPSKRTRKAPKLTSRSRSNKAKRRPSALKSKRSSAKKIGSRRKGLMSAKRRLNNKRDLYQLNLSPTIRRLKSQLMSDIRLTGQCVEVIQSLVLDILRKVAETSNNLAVKSKKKSVSLRDVETSIRMSLPKAWADECIQEAYKAMKP